MINRKIIILIIVIIAAVIGGLYLYNKDTTKKIIFNDEESNQQTEEQPTNAPVDEPTPTPDLKVHSIKVLNGSGEAGRAQEIKTFLEEKGYIVSSISNASRYDFTKTLIQYRKTVNAVFLGSLKTALTERFVLDEPQILEATNEGDIIVTIGTETP